MSDATITEGGIPVPAESYVTPDGVTIFGSGITENPLTTDSAQNTMGGYKELFTASTFLPGTPVYPLAYNSGTGLTELAQASAATAATAGVLGLVSPVAGPFGVILIIAGLMTMTTAEWDAVVQGESGGLTPGDNYYLNSNGAQKPIVNVFPDSDVGVNIGTAISPTTMKINIAGPWAA